MARMKTHEERAEGNAYGVVIDGERRPVDDLTMKVVRTRTNTNTYLHVDLATVMEHHDENSVGTVVGMVRRMSWRTIHDTNDGQITP